MRCTIRDILILTLLMLVVSPAFASPHSEMQDKIEAAKARLETLQKRITKERLALSTTLNSLESEVIQLRAKTAVARRQADEETLSLSQLENRLGEWQTQQQFQENLLQRFLMQLHDIHSEQINALTLSEKIQQINDYASHIKQSSTPTFFETDVVLNTGDVIQGNVLNLGPESWYIASFKQLAGKVNHTDGVYKETMRFGPAETASLAELHASGAGVIPVDTTLGGALQKQRASDTVTEHVMKGGVWVIPIVIFALIATSIALYKVLVLWRLPAVKPVSSLSMFVEQLRQSGVNAFEGMQRQLVEIYQRANSPSQREDSLFSALQQQRISLEKYNGAIAVTAAVAPLLGLLGTVSGMIETFNMMTAFGGSDPEVISGGIAKALVTTELGLVVAIPALILNALLTRKSKHYYGALENFAVVISSHDADDRSSAARGV